MAPETGEVETPSSAAWWRTTWMESVWRSDLAPLTKLIAACYYDHARDSRTAWVSRDRLAERTGMSRSTATTHLGKLVSAGFLTVHKPAGQHRSTEYLLTLPDAVEPPSMPPRGTQTPPSVPPPGTLHEPSMPRRGTLTSPSVPSPDTSVPSPGPHLSTNHNSSSSSPNRGTFATLTGWSEDDERLDKLDRWIGSQREHVRNPRRWMETLHERGDLLPNFLAFVERDAQSTYMPPRYAGPQALRICATPDCYQEVRPGRPCVRCGRTNQEGIEAA